jgi:lactoylglutathione lyase
MRLEKRALGAYALPIGSGKIMFRRIDHVAIHVQDLARSVAFYERHFGFQKYFQHAATGGLQIAYLKLGDTVLELTHKSDGAMQGFHFCLETDNLDETVARLQTDGVAMVRAPHETAAREPREQGWRRVVFAGPDGEQIELRG